MAAPLVANDAPRAPRRRGTSLNVPRGTPRHIGVPLRTYSDISEEEGPWARKTVLSFDGGGVRGYASLLITKRIMTRIRELEMMHEEYPVYTSSSYPWMGDLPLEPTATDEPPDRVNNFLPCHYFDYMAGTSTGGLTSIMLGRLRMSVDEALDRYSEFGNAVFGKPRWFHERSLLWYPRAKFSCRRTRLAFQTTIYYALRRDREDSLPHEASNEPFKYREDRTRTLAVSWYIRKNVGVSGQYVWRSYDNNFDAEARHSNVWNPSNPSSASTAAIWEVARATTSAPRWFESIKIGDRKFLDGGMVANNPSLLALREIHQLHDSVPALFVSIGTGLKNASEDGLAARSRTPTMADTAQALQRAADTDDVRRKQFIRKYIEIGRHYKDNMVDCEGEAGTNGWRSHCQAIGLDRAFRLNVEGNLSKISLDDWRPASTGQLTMKAIAIETQAYLERTDVSEEIDAIAEEAVRIRRQRAATERWESFAVDVTYRCPRCPSSTRYGDRGALRGHLKDSGKHKEPRLARDEVEAALNEGRIYKPVNRIEPPG